MRFMVLLRAPLGERDPEALASAMRGFDLGLSRAGVLVADGGFSAYGRSARLRSDEGGGDDAAGDAVAGCWLVSAPTKVEVLEQFRRCPALHKDGCEIEIHRLFDPDADGAAAASGARAAPASPSPKSAGRLSPRRLKAVVDYIEANLEHDLRIGTIARVAGCSPSHFRVLFRQSMGMPAHRYVIGRRVAHAVQLLTAGSMSISEAALASGFCHQSHLARAMRRVLGKSPSEAAGRRGEPPPAPVYLGVVARTA